LEQSFGLRTICVSTRCNRRLARLGPSKATVDDHQRYLIINVTLFAASLGCMFRSGLFSNPILVQALLVLFLLFSPVQSGIAQGQPSVICIS
jgi:hypothetical protein